MPIAETAGEVLAGLLRGLASFLIEIVLGVLVNGLGYFICRPFSRRIKPDDLMVSLTGIIGWAIIIGSLFFGITHAIQRSDIAACADLGGSYNHESRLCDHPDLPADAVRDNR